MEGAAPPYIVLVFINFAAKIYKKKTRRGSNKDSVTSTTDTTSDAKKK